MFQPLLPLAQMNTGRADFIARMHAQGIAVGIHYPALHLFSLYRARGFAEGMFPHAEHVGASTISLPLFPAMQDSDVTRVCSVLSSVLRAVLK